MAKRDKIRAVASKRAKVDLSFDDQSGYIPGQSIAKSSKKSKAPGKSGTSGNYSVRALSEQVHARATERREKADESVAAFMQLDFHEQIEAYNRRASSVNRQLQRLKKEGKDVSMFTELEDMTELLTEKGNIAKFGKRILKKYDEADEASKRRAEELLLRDYHKMMVATENIGYREYELRIKEKDEFEKAIGAGELSWKEYNAVKQIEKKLTYADYYAVMMYADEVGYIANTDKVNQPELKKNQYLSYLKEVNRWAESKGIMIPNKAEESLEGLKKLEAMQYAERPEYLGKKYMDKERRKIMQARGSKKLGL